MQMKRESFSGSFLFSRATHTCSGGAVFHGASPGTPGDSGTPGRDVGAPSPMRRPRAALGSSPERQGKSRQELLALLESCVE
mmetsp:Transcript_34779/g.110360  ORF Transcript_34779/g.110360 Transcript_34779/m.110360 type:complete len:82 (+) Transcript_34779:337-582(+)